MAKTIVFKPEFEKKLKKLRIKTKYVNNLMKPGAIKANTGVQPEDPVEYANNKHNWYEFIANTFIWKDTPEGFYFWSRISNL